MELLNAIRDLIRARQPEAALQLWRSSAAVIERLTAEETQLLRSQLDTLRAETEDLRRDLLERQRDVGKGRRGAAAYRSTSAVSG
jgi:hypothetical protein